MEISTSIVIQAVFLALALFVTLLRIWVRLRIEHRDLTPPDYLVWGGWTFTLGWFICSIRALQIGIDHPVDPETGATDSVEYLKTVFIACFFFDIGLYWPKASIILFYWWLIPTGFRRLRIALYLVTAYVAAAFVATILTDTLISHPISNNWSLENQLDSIWNSIEDFVINWVLNITTDILLFCLPFFVLNCLKLHRRQKIGLAGVFSLGMITMITSAARFATYIATDYELDDAAGNAWCTIEMCTAVIVVSLPGLKSLIARKERQSTKERSSNGYIQTSSNHASGNRVFGSQAHAERLAYDDEMELVAYSKHTGSTGMISKTDLEEETNKDIVVTTNFTVTRSLSQNNDELASEHSNHR